MSDISRASARFFMDQLTGCRNGDMAPVPYNPTLYCFMQSHGVVSAISNDVHRNAFIAFLRECADVLESDGPGF